MSTANIQKKLSMDIWNWIKYLPENTNCLSFPVRFSDPQYKAGYTPVLETLLPYNHLSHKIHIQILHIDLHTFLFRLIKRIWFRIKAFSLNNLSILIAFSLDDVLMLLGENWCWSLLGPTGITLLFKFL